MTDETLWRAFIGEPGHRTETNLRGVSWYLARDCLLDFARTFVSDGCEFCADAQDDALTALARLQPDTEWSGDIDWDTLILRRDVDDPAIDQPEPVSVRPDEVWPEGWTEVGATTDAADAPAPDVSTFRPMWLVVDDPVTGETRTLDVADAPVAGNGETIVVEWTSDGFLRAPYVERRPTDG
jgi:hypothetical protein